MKETYAIRLHIEVEIEADNFIAANRQVIRDWSQVTVNGIEAETVNIFCTSTLDEDDTYYEVY